MTSAATPSRRSGTRRGITLQEPIIWLVVAGILSAGLATSVGAFLDRAADRRTAGQLEQLARVAQAQVNRTRVSQLDTAHFDTAELTETTGAVFGSEARPAVSLAVTSDGLDAVAAMVSDAGHCVVLYLPRSGRHTVEARRTVDVAGGYCQAALLLP